ncbi:hypothetical protein [Pedobacter paludis]|uniref:Uncharacterized protein n=1 Tax=Pedobacter paludis TaxID=2203212 RepID=A0A317F407_9SPHI|nr:hypothetical protein [Pedobacter paludis]PWS32216.1 hypothetical protein DF947_10630 [Pedobacter paludis]
MKSDAMEMVDTMMSVPGMGEKVKFMGQSTTMSRRVILILYKLIAKGVNDKEEPGHLLENIPQDVATELKAFADDCLEKAGLVDFNKGLNKLLAK